ncbi:MAG: alpha/beta fold hydrolase [bacterium]|nr:alpha/beta fold hydrolase [bacterium]
MARRLQSHFLSGPAGRLEALLEEPESLPPTEAVLLCHPHPKYGGTMHNKVVYRMARGLCATGSAVLRFNFRGVNLSEGSWDHGEGELADARMALGWLREQYPALPFTLAGFSFGARISLQLGCDYPDARRMIVAGFPTVYHDSQYLGQCAIPRYFLQSTRDQYGLREELEPYFDRLQGPKELTWVEAEDHFFGGALDELEAAVRRISLQ